MSEWITDREPTVEDAMSEWITDRRPTAEDCNKSADVVWVSGSHIAYIDHWSHVKEGEPWMPITPPEPYVKPKRRITEHRGVGTDWRIRSKVRSILKRDEAINLQRYADVNYTFDPNVSCPEWCKSEDVTELEAKCAELEAKCAELKAKHEQLRAASFELVFAVGLTPFSGDFPANQLTRICNEVLALVDPLKKQIKSEGQETP